jgi:hypothetical protein
MSYDVAITESHNYTSNMRAFFEYFIGRPLRELDGMPAIAVERLITTALVRIAQADTRALQEYDSPNGWGDWETAADFLRRIRDDARRNPTETVKVSF